MDADAFAALVRDALARLYDPVYLQTHPLGAQFRCAPGEPVAGAGRRLEMALVEAIDALAARAGPGARGHVLLRARYVDALSVPLVCRRLGLGRSQFYIEHRRALGALTALLWERSGADRMSATPLAMEAVSPRTNLPEQLTSFVGREREVAAVEDLLRRSRLVTLTGAGGAGKTRLALRVAAGLLDAYPDGVWFVDLAPLADGGHVPSAALAALGVNEVAGRPPLAILAEYLRSRAALLVPDNCEHLLDGSARLADAVLRTCPRVRILATSRERLGLPGEVAWRVPSLGLPPDDGADGSDDGAAGGWLTVAEAEAVRLFVERTRLVQPDFVVTSHNAAAVARVCRQLDGIPLAVELAAARVRVLTVEQLAARLHDRFRLLTGGARTALRRQQTLQATIDWSHDLLDDQQQALFRRLSVFAGGFTVEAAEVVGAGDGIDVSEVLDLLTALADKSVLVAEAWGGQERYRLLETIRQYAERKLLASGEAARVRDRHRDWVAGLAAEAAPELSGPASAAWLDRLDLELDNIRTALAWCRGSPGGAERGLALAADLAWFWAARARVTEGIGWTDALLAAAPAATATRARALFGIDHLLRLGSADPARPRSRAEEALAIARRLDDETLVAEALARVGLNEATAGQYGPAVAHLEESLALTRRCDPGETTRRLRELGIAHAVGGDRARARALLEESGGRARAAGVARGEAMALLRLAALDRVEGDLATARARFERSLELMEKERNRTGAFWAERGLANVARSEGRLDEARTMLRAGLRLARRAGDRAELLHQVCSLGLLALAAGDHTRAVRLIATDATPEGLVGNLHTPDLRIEAHEGLVLARSTLGEAQYAAAWAEGLAMTPEQAAAYALEYAFAEPATSRAGSAGAADHQPA